MTVLSVYERAKLAIITYNAKILPGKKSLHYEQWNYKKLNKLEIFFAIKMN